MSLSTTSILSLNTSRDSDSTASLDNSLPCLTTLPEKKFFLTSNLNLSWHDLMPFLFVLSMSYVLTLFIYIHFGHCWKDVIGLNRLMLALSSAETKFFPVSSDSPGGSAHEALLDGLVCTMQSLSNQLSVE